MMTPLLYSRTYLRFPLPYPVIFGGAPFVGEGILTNLSLMGCSILCDREVLCGSVVRVSVLLPDQTTALSIDLGRVKWARGHQFGVEFLQLQTGARWRLNRALRVELIHRLELRKNHTAERLKLAAPSRRNEPMA
jgi:hypothetical protein